MAVDKFLRIVSVFVKYMTLFLWGGVVYYGIELAYRGHSHPLMFAAGGVCLLAVGALNNYLPWHLGLVWQIPIGAVIITAVELVFGLVGNVWLRLAIWDYSDLRFNFMGQISLLYSLYWVPLAFVAILLDDFLRWKLYGQERPRYTIFKTTKGDGD